MNNNNLSIYALPVVHFDDLDHAGDMPYTFDCVSYGDAEYTLVGPQQLISYLEDRNEEGRYTALIAELNNIPHTVFVALQG